MSLRYILSTLVNIFVGIAAVILGLRVFFRLFSANTGNAFVSWIYDTSDTLMAPFRGIFPPATLEGGIVLDVSAIFAIIMYLVFGAVLLGLISLIPEPAPVERPTVRRRKK
ncbi:YggT family protein [Candidatus Parcubacteria bacterium]|nr:YggT family protein [Candidatus Parcubacteria bacterium]